MNTIIRSLCMFAENPTETAIDRLEVLGSRLEKAGYTLQTKRIATRSGSPRAVEEAVPDKSILLALGGKSPVESRHIFSEFCSSERVSFYMDLTSAPVEKSATDYLFSLISSQPSKTFQFAYAFNNSVGSPYFPAAQYGRDGFAIGLQPTDLAADCGSMEDWFASLSAAWEELQSLFQSEPDFLGIDSSTAPLGADAGSLVGHLVRWHGQFDQMILSDTFVRITKFLKAGNPCLTGLCGLMLPCLEDFILADEYEAGRFSLERNIFLSLHSGLGIDTYPIGVNENPETIWRVLRLVQALSAKYAKPLSVRFVSDGQARIGERTKFENPYLKDVVVRAL